MADYRDDRSKYRTLVSGTHDAYTGTYNVDDRIGRKDSRDGALMSKLVATSTASLLPVAPMGRRDYIKVQNVGSVVVEIRTSPTASGIQVAASGGTWEDNTDGTFYIISTGADSEVRVYERSTR